MKELFIDVGSTDIKFRMDGERESQKIPFPMTRAQTPYFESDGDLVFEKIREIIFRYPEAKKILFSVQMHGYILRMKTGTVLPYVSWRDQRAEQFFAAGDYQRTLPRLSGTSYKANLAPVSLQYRERVEGLSLSDILELYTLGSYLVFRLTGNNATHVTDAAATGFFDVKGNAFSPWGFCLPQAVSNVSPVGIFEGKEIYPVVGDQQAVIASLSEEDLSESYILNLGTAAQICCVGKEYLAFEESRSECRPFFQDKYLYTITGLCGGEWFQKNADLPDAAEYVAKNYVQAIARLPDRRRLVVVGGGVAKHYGEVLERVLNLLGLNYKLLSATADKGLGNIMREEHEKRNRNNDQ